MESLETAEEYLGGYRLENDARVSYNEGTMEYSSVDGDLSELADTMNALGADSGTRADRFAAELASEYRWLDA